MQRDAGTSAALRLGARAAALDLVCILVFVGIGRSVHADGVTLAGMASTSWPFVTGAAAGWVLARSWRRPTTAFPTALVAVVCCVALGMVLRVVAGQGTKAPFVAVALAFLAASMLGWRVLEGAARRLAARRHLV